METTKRNGSAMQRVAREYAQREHTNREAQRAGKPTNLPTHDQNAIHQERMAAVPEYRRAFFSECARLDRGRGIN